MDDNLEVIPASQTGAPVFDIMVPTHNRIDLTMKCLQSIYFHTSTPFHLIVVDDSTDNLTVPYFYELLAKGVAPLGKVANLTFIHSKVPYREGNQFFNIALSHCKSEYMAIAMNSVRVEPEWEKFALETLMPNNPNVGAIGFKCLFGGDNNNVGRIESAGIKMIKYVPTDIGRDFPGHRLTGVMEPDAIQWAFCMVRVKAARGNLEEGVFHGFMGWDDISNSFSLKEKGWRILYCGLGVGYHEPRSTRGSNTTDAERKNKENGERFYKRHGFWDLFLKEESLRKVDVHDMPSEIRTAQEVGMRTEFQPNREEVPV